MICYFTDISCSSSCIQVEVGWWGRSEVEWLRRATWTAALELLVLRRGMSTSPLQLSYRPDFIDCHTHGNVVPKTRPFDVPCSCLEGICGDERTAARSQRQRDSRVDLTNCLSAVSTFRTYGYLQPVPCLLSRLPAVCLLAWPLYSNRSTCAKTVVLAFLLSSSLGYPKHKRHLASRLIVVAHGLSSQVNISHDTATAKVKSSSVFRSPSHFCPLSHFGRIILVQPPSP